MTAARSRRCGQLKVGGRGAWRVERSELEAFIARLYEETDRSSGRCCPRPADELKAVMDGQAHCLLNQGRVNHAHNVARDQGNAGP